MSIGSRLKEERERLGFTQPSFAALAETTKKSQIDYEKDITQPKAGYLAVIAKVGADVQYIITGLRSPTALTADANLVVSKYELASSVTRNKVLMLLLSDENGATSTVVDNPVNTGSGTQNNAKKINIHPTKKDGETRKNVKISATGEGSQAGFNITNNT